MKIRALVMALLATALLILSSCGGTGNNGAGSKDEVSFRATVLENNGSNLLVEPEEGSAELRSADKISVHVSDDVKLFDSQDKGINIDAIEAGDKVQIFYNGLIAESYPAQINKCYKIVLMD